MQPLRRLATCAATPLTPRQILPSPCPQTHLAPLPDASKQCSNTHASQLAPLLGSPWSEALAVTFGQDGVLCMHAYYSGAFEYLDMMTPMFAYASAASLKLCKAKGYAASWNSSGSKEPAYPTILRASSVETGDVNMLEWSPVRDPCAANMCTE